jgi:hypothetical protein
MRKSEIWFKISEFPWQIKPDNFYCAVQANGFEIAKITVVEISIHVIYHELGCMPRHKSASIACGFFYVSGALPARLDLGQPLVPADARSTSRPIVNFAALITVDGSRVFATGLAQGTHVDIYGIDLN